jgi:hypothetical protein
MNVLINLLLLIFNFVCIREIPLPLTGDGSIEIADFEQDE